MKSIQLITLFFLLIFSTSVYGYNQHYSGRVNANNISNGLVVEDFEYFDMQNLAGWSNQYYNNSSKGLVRIGVDHLWNGYISQSYDLQYLIDIKWYDEDGNDYLIEDVCMRVSYDPSAQTNDQDQATYVIDGAHKVEVIFVELYQYDSALPCGGTVVATQPENLYLEAAISVERYYLGFDETATWTNNVGSTLLDEDNDAKNDFIELHWDYVEGAEFYDVEWTHINNYKADGSGTARSAADILFSERDFSLNSTRISTRNQTYKIPMIFNEGYLVYRVRAVAKGGPMNGTEPTFGHWVFGKWSTDGNMLGATETLSDFPDMVQITANDAHDENKNWQHVATYAEDGKRKDVVTYYDGSMRNRQMVTRINSDDHVVVGQTVYDYQGREALQILPVPLHESTIKYREQFNKDNQQGELTKDDFDLDNLDPCQAQVLQLSTLDGAGKYYSSNNSNQDNWQAYVPDANGYAYTQIEYTPDNTGRVMRQTGVGEEHMLASGHESKYFYGQPAQEELDIIFGSNVGYDRHYKKNMVVDANGQVSVSYMDAHGRVIATSLAGDGITALENLKDENDVDQTTLNGQVITSNLLGNGNHTNNYVNADNSAITYNSEILVSTQGDNDFAYTLEIPAFSDTCLEFDLPVVVDLELGLLNDCGDELFTYNGGGNLTETLGVFSLTGGAGLTDSYNEIDGLTNNLEVGSYSVYKYLSVNQSALNDYAANYVDLLNPQCLLELQDFIGYQDSLLNELIDCDVSCEECVTELEEYYISEYGAVPTLETDPGYDAYTASYEDCVLPCEGKTFCETMREMMLNDVSPNGQYGEYDLSSYSTTNYPLSVFNTSNLLPSTNNYRDLQYYESDGSQSLIYLDPSLSTPLSYSGTPTIINGDEFVEPQQLNDLEDFIANWSPSWAESLLALHPEYCYLSFCDDLSTPSHQLGSEEVSSEEFDEILLSTISFSDAQSVDINGTTYNLTDLLGSPTAVNFDPYFNGSAATSSTYETMMTDRLSNYENNMSMQDFAAYSADCATFYGSNTGSCNSTYQNNDDAWNYYKSYYIAAKQEIQQLDREQHAIANGCFNGCIGTEEIDFIFTSNFWNVFSFFSLPSSLPSSGFFDFTPSYDLCSFTNYLLYQNKDARFPDPGAAFNLSGNDQQDVENSEIQTDYEYYELTGLCPNAVDIQNFLLSLSMDDALITTNNAIQNYGAFTEALYAILNANDGHTSTNYYPYEIESAESGSIVTIGFEESAVLSTCEITLELPGTTTLLWSDYGTTWTIGYMGNMNVTSNSTFTIEATTDDGTSIILDGTSGCFDLLGCESEFDQWLSEQCQPNIIAQELSLLMNTLLAAGELNSTSSVNIHQSPFIDIIENIDAIFGGTWSWIASGSIYTLSNGTDDIEIDLQGGSFSPSHISEILPNDQGTLNGIIHWIDGSGNDQNNPVAITLNTNDLPLGECGLAFDSYTCSETPQKKREGLEHLLRGVLTGTINNGDPLNYYSFFSNHLQDQLGVALFTFSGIDLSTSSDIISIVDDPAGTVFCDIDLEIIQNWQGHTFSDIASVRNIYALDGVGQLDAFGNTYSFMIHAQTVAGENILIKGTSCFSIANCENCYECVAGMINDDQYAIYNSVLLDAGLSHLTISYTQFINSGYSYDCVESYLQYLDDAKTVDAAGDTIYDWGAGFINITDYCTDVSGSSGVCDGFIYSDYEFFVTTDTLLPFYLSEEGFYETHALCRDEYIEYFANTQENLMTIEEFCEDISLIQECKPYQTGPFDIPEPDSINECEYFLDSLIDFQANHNYDEYIDGLVNTFIEDYKQHIMVSAIETYTRTYMHNEYQYTLYYYDQAGNLVQTVPPKGVDFVDTVDLPTVVTERDNNTKTTLPGHSYKTQYHYNSLNQLVEQTTPDTDGPSEFFYDALGRLVVSQNAKQNNYLDEAYSYTLYDQLGRVVEVGQISDVSVMSQTIAGETGPFEVGHSLFDWLNNGVINTLPIKTEVTQTHYDMALPDPAIQTAFQSTEIPSNWRNRIASITYQRDFDWNKNEYDNALHYRYDIHGNVSQQLQEVDGLTNVGRQFARVDYSYDLISGNVATVAYQTNKKDAFYHSYWYDADNRITHAFTSTDRVHWDRDAKYFYYEHGPLARTEIGHNKVQANDYAYTIQGWIKGVNSATLNTNRDQGKDADMGAYGNLNRFVAKDEVGYSLGYFIGDYTSIGAHSTTEQFEVGYSANSNFTSRNLYNGNITHMVTAIQSLMTPTSPEPQAMVYDYDQLNRIKSAKSFRNINLINNAWNTGSLSEDYATNYKYDLNGNLYNLKRNGHEDPSNNVSRDMDDIRYSYIPGTNKLVEIKDLVVSNTDYPSAIKHNNFAGWNYTYDEIGQLITDEHSEIEEIEWTVHNKVHKITRENGSIQPDMEFVYGPLGNRIAKIQKPRPGGTPSLQSEWIYTYYERDAQGNVMATYKLTDADGLKLTENTIYGSSRLGTLNRDESISLLQVGGPIVVGDPIDPLDPIDPVIPWPVPVAGVYSTGYVILEDSPNEVVIEVNGKPLNTTLRGASYPNILTFAQFLVNSINANSYSTGWQARSLTNNPDSLIIEISETVPEGKSLNLAYKLGGINQPNNIVDLGPPNCNKLYSHTLGNKNYELSNHLGNILTTVSDQKVVEQLTNVILMDDTFDNAGDPLGWEYNQALNGGSPPSQSFSITTVSGTLELAGEIGEIMSKTTYFEDGKNYDISFNVVSMSGTSPTFYITDASGYVVSPTTLSTGVQSFTITGSGTTSDIQFVLNSSPALLELDNIKITSDEEVVYYADVTSYSDYYPFGMQMPGRSFQSDEYRYGFQGQEKDDEVKGEGNSINYKFRMHDPRIGRFFAVDPLSRDFPHNSPYAFSENSTIAFIELEGLEKYYAADGTYLGQYKDYTAVRIVDEDEVELAREQLRLHSQNPDDYNGYLRAYLPNVGSESIEDYAESVEDVLNDAELETYANNNHNCNTAARAQMSENGTQTNGSANVIQTDVNNDVQARKNKGNLTENKIGGAIYVMTQLKNNNPVMVGVRESTSSSDYVYARNINALTGHFIVVSSMHISEDGSISFGYYDNANSRTGKSTGNRLDLNTSSGSMTDETNVPVGGVDAYEVSEVRTNVEN